MAKGRARETLETHALLVRSIPYGESDLVAQFFTERYGRVSSMVRGGARSKKRASGAFEPFHTLSVRLDDSGGDLTNLREAEIVGVRVRLVGSLAAMDGAGRVLRWARALCPPRTPEPEVWATLIAVLDTLDGLAAIAEPSDDAIAAVVVWAGLRLLAATGFGLALDACVACGKHCPETRAALIDVARGGVVCRACGGGGVLVDAKTRAAAIRLSTHVDVSDVRRDGAESLGAGADRALLAKLERLVTQALEHHEIERARPRGG